MSELDGKPLSSYAEEYRQRLREGVERYLKAGVITEEEFGKLQAQIERMEIPRVKTEYEMAEDSFVHATVSAMADPSRGRPRDQKAAEAAEKAIREVFRKATEEGMPYSYGRTIRSNFDGDGNAPQMTLGVLLDRLNSMPSSTIIPALVSPHSYRGYYDQIAFERGATTSAATQAALVNMCIGTVFEGYKGGEFTMTSDTPVWVANYGGCGEMLIDIFSPNHIVTRKD